MFTWSALTTPWDGVGYGAACLKLPSGRLVIGGSSGDTTSSILYSDDDGASWTAISTPLNDGISGLAYSEANGRLVGIGYSGGGSRLIHSDDDGETWSDDGDPFGGSDFGQCVTRDAADSLFVAGASGTGTVAISSPDGLTWTSLTTPFDGDGFSSGFLSGVAYSATLGLWLGVGKDATQTYTGITSADAATWSLATGPFDGFAVGTGGLARSITEDVANGSFVACGNSAGTAFATSPDFATWTLRSSPIDGNDAQRVEARAGKTLSVIGSGADSIVESEDGGATWTVDPSSPLLSGYGVCFIDDTHALAVGTFTGTTIAAFGVSAAATAPEPPTLDSATPGVGSVALAWTPGADGGSAITGYKVYRGSSSGSETLLATLGVVTSYVDHPPAGTSYYKVTAFNAIGESDASNELSAAPLQGPACRLDVAYGQDALTEAPTYTDIAGRVTGLNVHRGRQYLTDRTEAGTADADFVDTAGDLDPTNTAGPFYPMDPNAPARARLLNAFTGNYVTIFTGLSQGCPQTVRDRGAPANRGSLPLVDLFSLLALDEVPPGLDFTDNMDGTYTPVPNTTGNTKYPESTVQDRIKALLADAGVPPGLTNIFSGNVRVQEVTYSPGYAILAALQDAADAEFPGVANIFVDKFGVISFRGRLSRGGGDLPVSDYGVNTWRAGDAAAVAGNSDLAVIALNDLVINRDVLKVINNALFTPQGIADADIAGQLKTDPSGPPWPAGPRSITGQNLITAGATAGPNAGDPLLETAMFGEFYIGNFKDPENRIERATFRAVPGDALNAEAHWNLLCNAEIGDILSFPSGAVPFPNGDGLSDDQYFIEGISYQLDLGGAVPNVTMILDLSPVYEFFPATWNANA